MFGNNDLVNRENCARGLGGELNCPGFGSQEVENAVLGGVKGSCVVVVLGEKTVRFAFHPASGFRELV